MAETLAATEWIPRHAASLQVGPARWTGKNVATDIALARDSRMVRIGLRERCLLELIDGRRTVSELAEEAKSQGLFPDAERVGKVLRDLLMVGALERPFLARSGLNDLDTAAAQGPTVRKDQVVVSSRIPELWRT